MAMMVFLETLLWGGLIISFVLKDGLLLKVGGGFAILLLSGIGSFFSKLRNQDHVFWKYVEYLSFCFMAINFLCLPVMGWKDVLLRTVVFILFLLLNNFLILSLGRNYFPELKKLPSEDFIFAIQYNSYKSGLFLLGIHNIFYAGIPLGGFTALARTDPKILQYFPWVLSYSISVSGLIHALFVKKAKKIADIEDRVKLPDFFSRVFFGIFFIGLVYELLTRRQWFFFLTATFFLLFSLKTLPAYVKRSQPILPHANPLPNECSSLVVKTIFFEILFFLLYGIFTAFVLGLLVF